MRTLVDLENGGYESLYLCPSCHHPLYVQVQSQLEVCLNHACAEWPADYSAIADAREEHSPKVYKELEDQRAGILSSIRGCNLGALRRFAHDVRRNLSQSLLNRGGMQMSDWHAISELLVLTQSASSTRIHMDGEEDHSVFLTILRATSMLAERMRMMEDFRTGRYLVVKRQDGTISSRPFGLKYLAAVRNTQQINGGSTFEYEDIDTAATPSPTPGTTDLGEILETLWPFTLSFRRALRSHSRTSQLYNYQPNPVDFSVLAGYWAQCSEAETGCIPADKEIDELNSLDPHLKKFSDGKVTAVDFVERFIDCKNQAPAIIRTPEGWLFDKTTLLLYMLYLQGDPGLVDKNIPRLVEPLLTRMQGRAGQQFEFWLREELCKNGFRGPSQPITIHYEYDILMVSETQRTIVLADAKYRDINQSSTTGANLLNQELLNDDALMDEAIHQEERLAFFLKNKSDFGKFLTPEQPWTAYQVRSYLVTKSSPLISKFGNTAILRAREFLASTTPS